VRTVCLSLVLLLLCAAATHAETVYYRAADGSWTSMDAPVTDGHIRVSFGPDAVPAGKAVIVINKPDWMVLDDTEPPQIGGLTVNGAPRPSDTAALALGSVVSEQAEIVLDINDDKNPIAADSVYFTLGDAPGVELRVDASGIAPPETTGRAVINMSGLKAGGYQGSLTLTDMAPLANSRTWPVSLTIIGISVAEDMQKVSLATEAGAYEFEPGLGTQIRLPNGMRLYLTGSMRGWRYPQSITGAELIEDTAEAKTVLISSDDLIDNEKKPIENEQERMEYELTIRPDTPALLVKSRIVNTGAAETGGSYFWGWLGGAHFVTPDGVKHEWEGVAKDNYIDVGRVGWVWIAPSKEGQPGIAWMSDLRFNQSRFHTMLLKPAESAKVPPGGAIEAGFAIALTDTPEQVKPIYDDLVARGLIAAPPSPYARG